MNFITQPWPWYVSGPLIAVIMFLLLYSGKCFGMSSNLRTLCTMAGAGKSTKFFNFNWREQKWNLLVLVGAVVGGYIGMHFLTADPSIPLSSNSVDSLKSLGFENPGSGYLPEELFALKNLGDLKVLAILLGAGFLVGFGSRYAGGCTSGHAISGLSDLQVPSLIAVVGFFIGGLIMVHLLFPLIF